MSTTVDVLTSFLDDSEAHGSSRTNDNIQSFHFTINKIETETHSAPVLCFLQAFMSQVALVTTHMQLASKL